MTDAARFDSDAPAVPQNPNGYEAVSAPRLGTEPGAPSTDGPYAPYAPVPQYAPLTAAPGSGLSAPGVKSMLFGFGLALVGLVVTVGSYLFAPGGHFLLLWGPIIFGAIAGVRGLITFLKS